MRCECEWCNGTGEVRCEECNGDGLVEVSLEDMKLEPGQDHFDELMALKDDARRVRRDTERLIDLLPHRANSYRAQRDAALKTINRLADELVED